MGSKTLIRIVTVVVTVILGAFALGCSCGKDTGSGNLDPVAKCVSENAGWTPEMCWNIIFGRSSLDGVPDGKSDAVREEEKARSWFGKAKAKVSQWTGSSKGARGAMADTFSGTWLGWIILAVILAVSAFVIHRRHLWGEVGRNAAYLLGIPAATFLLLTGTSMLFGAPVSAWPGNYAPGFWLIFVAWVFAEFTPYVVDDAIYIGLLFLLALGMSFLLLITNLLSWIPFLNLIPALLNWFGGPAWWYWVVFGTVLMLHFFPNWFGGRRMLMIACYIGVWLVVGSLSTN